MCHVVNTKGNLRGRMHVINILDKVLFHERSSLIGNRSINSTSGLLLKLLLDQSESTRHMWLHWGKVQGYQNIPPFWLQNPSTKMKKKSSVWKCKVLSHPQKYCPISFYFLDHYTEQTGNELSIHCFHFILMVNTDNVATLWLCQTS